MNFPLDIVAEYVSYIIFSFGSSPVVLKEKSETIKIIMHDFLVNIPGNFHFHLKKKLVLICIGHFQETLFLKTQKI